MPDLSRIVAVVQIENVRLREARCRSAVHPSETASAVNVNTSRDATVVKEPGDDGCLRIETTFTMEVHSANDEEQLQAEIRATFELSYRIPTEEDFSSEQLKAFGQNNAVFNAWPYWRELVQSSLARMSMPTLTVPVFRVLPRDAIEENENGDD